MTNVIISYLIAVNIIAMIFMYICAKTTLIKFTDSTINFILIIISLLGGSVGVLVTSQLVNYKKEEKMLKRVISLIIFIEVVVALFIMYQSYK